MTKIDGGRHILSAFDDDLTAVMAQIAEMGGIAENMFAQALEGVERRDVALCRDVIQRDRRLDELEMATDEMVTRTLALRAPVAQDLRLLICALKMSSTLERVGDLSKSIARRGIELSGASPLRITASVVRMGHAAQRQLSESLDAFIQRDVEAATAVWRRDVEIDELYNALFRELITYMMEDPRTIGAGSHYLFIAKNIERAGDHATHVAELTHYLVEGEALGIDRPRGAPSAAPSAGDE